MDKVSLSDSVTWDSLNKNCLVVAYGNNGGVPSSMLYGVGLCIVVGNNILQLYLPNSSDTHLYMRQKWEGTWMAWKGIEFSIIA